MSIAIIGMLDEREESLRLLKDCIEARGRKTALTDISLGKGAIHPTLRADISGEELARAAGTTLKEIKGMVAHEEKKAAAVMTAGLRNILLERHQKGELQGVVAVAGLTGSLICLPAMKNLPFGMPKLLISSAVAMPSYAKGMSEFFGVRDITVMHSVVDTVGMNPFVRTLMENGAGSICGMVDVSTPAQTEEKPSIAMTEWGYSDVGAHYLFEAFIDLAPGGFSEYLMGGNRAAGPDRLDAGRKLGKPYVLSPCGFDMIGCGPMQRRDQGDPLWTSRKISKRKLFIQDPMRVQARTNPEEMKMIAREVAGKLNAHPDKGLVKVLIPMKGFSSLSVEGGPLHDPNADQAFIEELEKDLDSKIEIIKVNNHINTREFAEATVDALNRALL